nr:MAG TPA: hypothetical protein [Caudoviricetes sp.]
MEKWKYKGTWCDTVAYEKGNVANRTTAGFNVKTREIDIFADRWVSNGLETLLNPYAPDRWTSKYGHFERCTPILTAEDSYWIATKARELFGDEKEMPREIKEIKRQVENAKHDLCGMASRNNMPLMLYGLDTAFDAVLDIIKCVGEGNNVTD